MQLHLVKYFLIASALLTSCNTSKKNELSMSGEALSKAYCGSCHAYTEPSLLDKNTWKYGVLPQMGHRLGIYENQTRASLIEQGQITNLQDVFPAKQVLSNEEWEAIKKYFQENAPDKLDIPKKEVEIKDLKVTIPDFHVAPPMVTAIKYNKELNQVYVADTKEEFSAINILDKDLNSISTLALPSPISHISNKGDTIIATLMGSFTPTDIASGSLIKIFKRPGEKEYKGFKSVLKGLQRPVQSTLVDVNNDGLEDVIVCEFGNHTGKLSLHIKQKNGQYKQQILSADPGATAVEITDLNKDGLKDIMVLMSQGKERIDVYYNLGEGNFTLKTILKFPPLYGSTSFSVLDWNKDGYEDVVYVNGDNADFSRFLKPYHGLRIYLNDGKDNFNEAFFQHQNGAYKAIVQDFDKDGDLDISLISYFPDLINSPTEGFIFMENQGGKEDFKFEFRSFNRASQGRWLVMETVDFNQNNNKGLLLGSFSGMAINGDNTGEVAQKFAQKSPTIVLLNFE
ncbi:VCBS repeat-containing protein [uncultured Arcticibacterium sp.]|uniref:FG-GAP repeat domain-containing protein n=1 Tax=uncultured Arcticibacterium sp. TaxID=2173042 RepID=UPI0030F87FC8